MVSFPVFYPVFGPVSPGGFAINMPRACFFAITDFSASGMLLPGFPNYCYAMAGTGTANGHHSFTFVLAGTTMTFTGGVVGTLQWTPDALNGQSCMTGVTQSIVAGTLALMQ